MAEALLDTDVIRTLYDPHTIFYLILVVAVFFLGKWANDRFTSYDLNRELTGRDNKAVAVSFTGYLFSLAIILAAVLGSGSSGESTGSVWGDLGADLLATLIWSASGILLLQVAHLANDKLLLHRFSNEKELTEDQNVGTGAVQCGAYIGSALVIAGAISGDDSYGLGLELAITGVYFVVAQAAFIALGFLYQLATRYDLHAEIEDDNIAAGASFGMTLVAIGLLLSGYLVRFDSLLGLLVWFLISTAFLIGFRFIVDRVILPGAKLDDEISRDQNWGAALIEGGCAIGLALILNASF